MGKLFFRELGEQNSQPLIILHGLFGSSDNWLTLGKKFADKYHVYIIDQRNHGQSFHSSEFSYSAMAQDLSDFIKVQKISSTHILGHSMGGKTAMEFAIYHPNWVDKLIIADIGPKSYPVHHSAILKGLFSINLMNLESRKQADQILEQQVSEIGVRQFLLKNLTRNGGGFEWKIDLNSIAKNIEEVGKGMNENAHYGKPTLFIRGGNSDYIVDDDINKIHSIFSNSFVETIPGVGHWLHAEKPDQFLALTLDFLNN